LEQVIVEDAPNLEKFFLDGAEYCLSIRVVWARTQTGVVGFTRQHGRSTGSAG
jgi:hypothetical protein